jgi:deoxyribodipyrimidine photolyase-related protein
MKHEATIILPHQLFEHHPGLDKDRRVVLVEHSRFFTDFKYHKQKLLFHRASMHQYLKMLEKKEYEVTYLTRVNTATFIEWLTKEKITKIHTTQLCDTPLHNELIQALQKQEIFLQVYISPMFLSPPDFLQEQLTGKESYFAHSFYVAQRKRMDILLTRGKPVGGTWSFDKENRKGIPSHLKIPPLPTIRRTKLIQELHKTVENDYAQHPGQLNDWIYPTTHEQAKHWLEDFLEHRLAQFGDYQDAMDKQEPFMFHSLLSPLLNVGLLTPEQVITITLEYAQKYKIPLNSLEGFIRQVIGWREFVWGIYSFHGEQQRTQNFFNHHHQLPKSFWTAHTNILPVDSTINKIFQYAYAHHIERLMILGNFMLLCEIDPHAVYSWFMEFFIDAYDWVMVPNVYGMSQYADGGLMTTKPYISSSAYILRMSNYSKGDWCNIWDALYWRFIKKHEKTLSNTPRTKIIALYLARMQKTTLEDHLSRADNFLKVFLQ